MSSSLNLVRDPWVMVCDRAGVVSELSLIEVFENARDLSVIAGELPTQAAAVLRLHLAIAYRALRHGKSAEAAMDEWRGWWDAGSLPVDRIVEYLEKHEDRFHLFHDTAPFMQVADLHTASGKTSGLGKLIAEVPDGHLFFTTRAGASLTEISPAEAARWLVHAQTYDPSGIKSGAVGDPTVKGGKGYPIGQGWSGRIGLVFIEGRTLAETLLLNLVHGNPSNEKDSPVWERGPQTGAPDGLASGSEASSEPRGVADLLTWQVRRVRLIHNEDVVTDTVIANGDRITPQNRQSLEYGTAYRFSENQTKVHGHEVYMPLEHRPEQALWRGLSALLTEPTSGQGERASRLRPPVLDWLAELKDDQIVPAGHPIRMHAIGVEYGSQASSIAGVIDDSLALHFGAITDPVVRARIVDAAEATQRAVRVLQDLAANLVRAAGGESEGAKARAAELGYAAVDPAFRQWLSKVSTPEHIDEHVDRWHRAARSLLRRVADELIQAAGPPAIKGRMVSLRAGSSPTLLDAGLADIYFRKGLRKALDRGLDQPADTPTPTKETA